MIEYFADLHIHIGRTAGGQAVKVTASEQLTFANILREATERKGLDAVGIVDCASPPVLDEIEELISRGEMRAQDGGGLLYRERLAVFPAAEVGVDAGRGEAHFIAYLPDHRAAARFSAFLARHVTNVALSSQKARCTPAQLVEATLECGGFLVPAHAFTPHKGYYGHSADRLADAFDRDQLTAIPAVELGLSCDTEMASRISELDVFTFLSNSDAHSLSKIAREYNRIRATDLSFASLRDALTGKAGAVVANYGLDPRLGKYHRTFCEECAVNVPLLPERVCPHCGGTRLVVGVADRLDEIADRPPSYRDGRRPPYRHQVPLEYVPGVGPRTLDRLIAAFGSEMRVLHDADESQLARVVPAPVAQAIVAAREGRLRVVEGGGGRYGRVDGRPARLGAGLRARHTGG